MNKLLTALLIMLSGAANAQNAYTEKVKEYVARYKDWAIEEQRRTGIPAAIKLSQGIYETGAGESKLCLLANNHFGIKCKSNWTGKTFSHTDDAPDECFRNYDDARSSYADHSDFLKNNKRYSILFSYNPDDYKKWCTGLKSCGYATNPAYAQRLIKIIEDYDLNSYTLLAMNEAPKEIIPEQDNGILHYASYKEKTASEQADNKVVLYNNLKAVYCKKGTPLLDVAIQHNLRYAKLLEINDLPDAPVPFDMYIYLERKPTKGIRNSHYVQKGETMLMIAQKEGLQLESLRRLNQMKKGEEPVTGTELQLQESNEDKPEVVIVENKQTEGTKPFPVVREEVRKISASATPKKEKKIKQESPLIHNSKEVETISTPEVVQTMQEEEIENQTTQEITEAQTNLDVTPAPRVNKLPTKKRRGNPTSTGTFNIANEKSVEEQLRENGGYNPRYVDYEKRAAEEKQRDESPSEEKINNEAAGEGKEVKSSASNAQSQPNPANEFDALKAKLDRIVYTSPNRSTTSKVENKTNTIQPPQAAPTAVVTGKVHVVKQGETAFGIAKKYGISMKQLVEWNNLDFKSLQVGQKLKVSL